LRTPQPTRPEAGFHLEAGFFLPTLSGRGKNFSVPFTCERRAKTVALLLRRIVTITKTRFSEGKSRPGINRAIATPKWEKLCAPGV
jgi:hypothetical protein